MNRNVSTTELDPQKYLMAEHFLNGTVVDKDASITTDIFSAVDQQFFRAATKAADIPDIVGHNPILMVNRDHQYHLNLKTFDLKEHSGSNSNGLLATAPSGFVQEQMTCVSNSEDFSIGVEMQDPENAEEVAEEELTVDENGRILMTQGTHCENDEIPLDHNSDHNGYAEEGFDEQLHDALQIINDKGGMQSVNFVAIESEKPKNPPYMIGDEFNIVAKDNEPIKFCLQGSEVDQIVTATLRYTEEKFKNNPVLACKLHRKDDNAFAFMLSAAGEEVKQGKENILDHPTVHFRLQADNLSLHGSFTFYITMLCLNSCHKSDGKRVELVLKVLGRNEERLIKESRFNIRVCRNVKRDFREAFPEGVLPPKKVSKPGSFIRKREPQDHPIVAQQEAQPSKCKVNMVRMSLPDEKAPEERVVIRKKSAQPAAPNGNKFYLVQLPTAETEKVVLQIIKLFGGTILNLETIYPLEESNDDLDVEASP